MIDDYSEHDTGCHDIKTEATLNCNTCGEDAKYSYEDDAMGCRYPVYYCDTCEKEIS